MMVSVKCYSYLKVLPASKREVLATLRHEHAVYVRPDVALTENIFSIVCCKFFISVFFFLFWRFYELWILSASRGGKNKRKKSCDIVPMHVQLIKDFVCKNLKKINNYYSCWKLKAATFKSCSGESTWLSVLGECFRTKDMRLAYPATHPMPRDPAKDKRLMDGWKESQLSNYLSVKLHPVALTWVELCFRSAIKGFLLAFSSRKEKCRCISMITVSTCTAQLQSS